MSNQVELKSKEQLNNVIVNNNSKPYKTAIEIYWYLRSWYAPIKAKKSDNKEVNINKLHTDGIHLSKEKLSTKFNISKNTLRRALAYLEELGLISRGFEKKGISVNHLVLYVWKDTPYFYNKFGVDYEKVGELKRCTTDKSDAQKIDKYPLKNDKNEHTPMLIERSKNQKREHTQTLENISDVEDGGYEHFEHTPPMLTEKIENKKMSIPQEQSTQGIEGDRGMNAVSIPPMLKNDKNEHTPYAQNEHTDNKGKKIDKEISPKDISLSISSSCSDSGKKRKKIKKEKTADGENTENSESRFFNGVAKSSYAFLSDEDLPHEKKANNVQVGKNAFVASSSVQASPVAPVANSLAVGLAKEVANIEPSPATSYLVEAPGSISEEEHNRISGMIPLPEGSKEIYESVIESATPEASIHELVSTDKRHIRIRNDTLPTHENQNASGEMTKTNSNIQNTLSPETLSNANPDHPKWQDLNTQVLKTFRSEMAWGIIHNLQIRSIKPNRLNLSFSRDLGMNEEQKENLRSCLRHVYGPTIEMVISRPDREADPEVLNCKVFVADERTPMPKPLKEQFKMMEEEKAELDTLVATEEYEVTRQVEEVNQVPLNRKKRSAMQISVEHSLALAETKWAQVRVAVENSFGKMLKERFVEYFKKVEVVGMTDRLLKLKAHFLTAENMQTHQGIIEQMASRYDVDLEVENTSDGSKEYYPWTYASHENEPFELSDILKKI